MKDRFHSVAGDLVRVLTDVPSVLDLASRLWGEGCDAADGAPGAADGAILIEVRGVSGDNPPRGPEGDPLVPVWTVTPDGLGYDLDAGGALAVRFDLRSPRATASVRLDLPSREPALAARLLLECPVAMLLSQRGHQLLHAGAILFPGGAVVLRGPSGAGKSTLVAAAHREGFEVLGDESLLVSRRDPDDLAASVRELTVLEPTAALLDLWSSAKHDSSGRERKLRVEIALQGDPGTRRTRRAATVLLGPREPGPARLTPLSPSDFLHEFRKGEIPQERAGQGDPDPTARAWAEAGGWLLTGASDLSGAVALLSRTGAGPR